MQLLSAQGKPTITTDSQQKPVMPTIGISNSIVWVLQCYANGTSDNTIIRVTFFLFIFAKILAVVTVATVIVVHCSCSCGHHCSCRLFNAVIHHNCSHCSCSCSHCCSCSSHWCSHFPDFWSLLQLSLFQWHSFLQLFLHLWALSQLQQSLVQFLHCNCSDCCIILTVVVILTIN